MRRRLIAFLAPWVAILFVAYLLPPSSGQSSEIPNLLQNPGFEEGTTNWLPYHTNTDFTTVTDPYPVHEGDWAASLNITGATSGEVSIYQDVKVIGGGVYALSGWARPGPDFDWVMLRIEWRDASEEVGCDDSETLPGGEGGYQLLTIPQEGEGESVQAPTNAVKARIKCIAYTRETDPAPPVLFDELSFTWEGWKVHLPLVMKNQ